MTKNIKEELYKQSSSICITEIIKITCSSGELRLINNNEARSIDGQEYTPCGLTYKAPSMSSDGILELDDVTGNITYLLQSESEIFVEISLIDADNTSYRIEGPIKFKVDSASVSSNGKCSLTIIDQNKLSFSISKYTYSIKEFPGLFG